MLWEDPRAKDIIETLRNAGLSDLQINNAFVELDRGGTVEDAHLAMDKVSLPIPATTELELALIELERNDCFDVYPNGARAWASNY